MAEREARDTPGRTEPAAGAVDKGPLLAEVNHELRRWELSTPFWGGVYGIAAGITIALPLVIAAQASLVNTPFDWIPPLVPIIALLVAIAAGIDQGLKPRLRWHAYTDDRRDARALRTEIAGSLHPTRPDIERWRKEWKEIQERHGKNLP